MTAAAIHWNHADAIDGIFVSPRADNPREFQAEVRPAVIVGFSAPAWVVQRNWGWMGDVLVRFGDGTQAWQGLPPKVEG